MPNNIEQKALNRLISQYQDSRNFISLISQFCAIYQEIDNTFDDLMEKRFIDTADGEQLDIIGEIVGQPRLTLNSDSLYYFGFQGSLNTLGFSSTANPTAGGLFYTSDSNNKRKIPIGDELYRLLIRAKIQRNICSGTPDEIIKAVEFIFNCSDVIFKERTLSIEIGIGKKLTHNEIELIKQHIELIPRPLGIKLSVVFHYKNTVFGFNGCPKSKGFASSSNPAAGGNFAVILIDNT